MFTVTAPALKDALAPSWTFLASSTKPWSTQGSQRLGGGAHSQWMGLKAIDFQFFCIIVEVFCLRAGHNWWAWERSYAEHPCPVLFAAPLPYSGAYYAAAWHLCLVLPLRLAEPPCIVACRSPALTFHIHAAMTEGADTDSPGGYSPHSNQNLL